VSIRKNFGVYSVAMRRPMDSMLGHDDIVAVAIDCSATASVIHHHAHVRRASTERSPTRTGISAARWARFRRSDATISGASASTRRSHAAITDDGADFGGEDTGCEASNHLRIHVADVVASTLPFTTQTFGRLPTPTH